MAVHSFHSPVGLLLARHAVTVTAFAATSISRVVVVAVRWLHVIVVELIMLAMEKLTCGIAFAVFGMHTAVLAFHVDARKIRAACIATV